MTFQDAYIRATGDKIPNRKDFDIESSSQEDSYNRVLLSWYGRFTAWIEKNYTA